MATLEHGMSREQLAKIREQANSRGLPDPYRACAAQANNARVRGIAWEMTFAQWWDIWEPYYHLRGKGTNGLCMARERDDGPYAVGNVYLTTNLGNLRDYHQRCSRAIEVRQDAKEKKEIAFARRGSTAGAGRDGKVSQSTWKAHNTSKSTCNYKDDDISYELSTP